MRDYNRMILLGRVGGAPERRETKNGVPVAHFSVATSRGAPAGQAETPAANAAPQTEWHRVVVWGSQGEHCVRSLSKGDTVLIEGSVRSHTYLGADQRERVSYEIHAQSVSFLGRRQRATARPNVELEASTPQAQVSPIQTH